MFHCESSRHECSDCATLSVLIVGILIVGVPYANTRPRGNAAGARQGGKIVRWKARGGSMTVVRVPRKARGEWVR